MNETFKTIKDYEGLYEISNFGRVKSLNYNGTKKKGVLKSNLRGSKSLRYLSVVLYNNNERKNKFVHRIVAINFIPNPGNFPQVNHIDNNPLNNHVNNLEWCTARNNKNHGMTFHETSSDFPGVSWSKQMKKWEARIRIKSKYMYLGRFVNELEAAKAYQNALKELDSNK